MTRAAVAVFVAVIVALGACRGDAERPPAPKPAPIVADGRAAPADAALRDAPVDAAPVDAAPVDAAAKPPQRSDCARVAGVFAEGWSIEETRERKAALLELCPQWPKRVVACVIANAKAGHPDDCLDALPAPELATYKDRMLTIYKRHNDYIGPDFKIPGPPNRPNP